MPLPNYTDILNTMSPTITWQDNTPCRTTFRVIFTKALACTVYPRLTTGKTLAILGDDSGLQPSTNPNESLLVTLPMEELVHTPVNMFTTVFIGNSQTKIIDGKLVTPRGYHI